MSWRRLSMLVLASSMLVLLLGCASSGLAVQRGLLRPPTISLQFSRYPLIALISFTTRCGAARAGSQERQQNYVIVAYMPDRNTAWGTSGRFLLDTPIRC